MCIRGEKTTRRLQNLSFSSVSRLLIIHRLAVQKNEHLWCRGCWLATTPYHTGLHRCCHHSGCNDHTGILPVLEHVNLLERQIDVCMKYKGMGYM